MDIQSIERDLRARVGEKVRVCAEGRERYRILTPFLFDDGDHLSIVLKKLGAHWVLSDEGHTLMRLTYDIDARDLLRGSRQKLIESALHSFDVENEEGEFVISIRDEDYGDALFSFVQSLLKISDVSYLTRERAKSTFWDDFRYLIEETVPDHRRQFEYHDPSHDPDGNYLIDCRINQMPKPLFVFAMSIFARKCTTYVHPNCTTHARP